MFQGFDNDDYCTFVLVGWLVGWLAAWLTGSSGLSIYFCNRLILVMTTWPFYLIYGQRIEFLFLFCCCLKNGQMFKNATII